MKNGPIVYKGDDLKKGARIILKNKLFWKTGVISLKMMLILKNLHRNVDKVQLVVYWNKNKAVACVYKNSNEVMAYCLPRYRNRGYASQCVKSLSYSGKTYAYSTKFRKFWKKQHVKIEVKKEN